MSRPLGSWLSGPQAGVDPGADAGAWRGEKLGFGESGPGSLASSWPRVLGLFVDWVMCYGVSLLFVGFLSQSLSTVVLGIWFVVGLVTVTLFSFTPGQFVVGMRVVRVDGAGRVGIVRAFFRQLLIVFIVPPLLNDADGRGLHDRATGTALVRTR
ncbi:MAG: RDD family protein [Gordonia paraffinivorans]